MDRHRRARQVQEHIRLVLLRDWDPVGVRDIPEARSEYDSYVGQMYGLLASGASTAVLIDRLRQIEMVDMGLPASDSARLRAVVRKLRMLEVRL